MTPLSQQDLESIKTRPTTEIAQDVVLKWTSDKNVSIKMHGSILRGNDILLTDCIKEALDQERAIIESLLGEVGRLQTMNYALSQGKVLELKQENSRQKSQLEKLQHLFKYFGGDDVVNEIERLEQENSDLKNEIKSINDGSMLQREILKNIELSVKCSGYEKLQSESQRYRTALEKIAEAHGNTYLPNIAKEALLPREGDRDHKRRI